MTTNRRDVLKGATGLAAAGAIGGVLAGGSVEAAGPSHAIGQGAGAITGQIGNLGSFEVLAFSWGLSNSGTSHTGGGAGSGKATIQDLSFTKYIDQHSPDLFFAVAAGVHFPDASVAFVGRAGSQVITIGMEEVMVTALSTGASAGEAAPTENVTISFAKVTFAVDTESEGWNIPDNAPF